MIREVMHSRTGRGVRSCCERSASCTGHLREEEPRWSRLIKEDIFINHIDVARSTEIKVILD